MRDYPHLYIDGAWAAPLVPAALAVVNPASEAVCGHIAIGGAGDVDKAVQAARRAFPAYAATSRADRIALLAQIVVELDKRQKELASAITEEMGAPAWLAQRAQAPLGAAHFRTAIEVLKTYSFETRRGATLILKEPIGVCGLITPWNWPLNQIACKVAPALAVGCAVVLKPSEIAPFSALIFAEALAAAGVPAGVFNLVNGDGPTVGAALSAHPDVDLVSFTGSTRAGVDVARAAAPTVKRVHQELGGKSANILLDDADLDTAVAGGVKAVMLNSGQSCNAPTRMLAPRATMAAVVDRARATAQATTVGDPRSAVQMGPVVSQAQWDKIQSLIRKGLEDGATLVAGGPGKPAGLDTGFYVKPTVFADVTPAMTIAREEIFGPVLSILAYDTVEEAIAIANDTVYGLSAAVSGADAGRCLDVARRLRTGQVVINGAAPDLMAPFGGYKMSGNGREWGDHAFAEFLEVKAVLGAPTPVAGL